MAETSNNDLKYFLQRVLDKHAEKEELPKESLVPSFENLQPIVVDDTLIEKFVQALWFNTKRVTAVWGTFMAKHASDVFASRENYLNTVLSMLYYMGRIEVDFERFTCCLSTVTAMAGFCHRERNGEFIHFTAAIMLKVLQTNFKGDWRGLKTYVSRQNYLAFYHTASPGTTGEKRCNKKVETLAKTVKDYVKLQKITFTKLVARKHKTLLTKDVVKCFREEINPHLATKVEEDMPEELDTSAQPAAGESIRERPEELDTSFGALSLSGELERAESTEMSTASAAASRAIQQRAKSSGMNSASAAGIQGSSTSSESGNLSPTSRKIAEEKAKEDLISAIADAAHEFLNHCPPESIQDASGEAQKLREDLAKVVEDFRYKFDSICRKPRHKSFKASRVSESDARRISKRPKGPRDEAVVMPAAASKIHGPMKTVPKEKREVPSNEILHCKDGPDPWLLAQGATFKTGEYLKEQILRTIAVVHDRHIACEHRRLHPIPDEVEPREFAGYSQETNKRLNQAELDRSLLLQTRAMIYDSKCEVDKLAEIIDNFSKENY